MIKLTCTICNYSYSVSEGELLDNPELHQVCLLCGAKLFIENLEEIVKEDIYKRAENYLNKWFAENGIEGTLEILERNKTQPTYKIYVEILRKRGLIK